MIKKRNPHMKVITAKVPPREREQFKALAERESTTPSGLVRLLVLAALKHDAKTAPIRG